MSISSNRREEYQFAKDYYQDLNDEESPAFVLEKGFHALTGNSYSIPEIKYLLSFDNPTEMIKYRENSLNLIVSQQSILGRENINIRLFVI